jgi:hypothetical protein
MIQKPRQLRITFRPHQSSKRLRMGFSAGGGIRIEGENGPIEANVLSAYTGYTRKKGFKTINQIPMDNQFRIEHPDFHLSTYDHFLIVDTNTVTITGAKVSATCALAGTSETTHCGSGVELIFTFIPTEYYEFRNLGDKPEVMAWWFLIKGLQQDPAFSQEKRFAIIVDSEKGSLEDINCQRKPVFKQDYLPSNCRLLYASSDVGKEYGLNQLFSKCDKEAGKFANYLRHMYLDSGFPGESVGAPFFRFWSFRKLCDGRWTDSEPIGIDNATEVDPRIFLE